MWHRSVAAIATVCLIVGLVVLPADSSATTRNRGYWIAGANAQVFAFGDGQLFAQRERRPIRGQIEDMAAHPSGHGYWLLGRDGGVYAYGAARDLGQGGFREQNAAAMAATPSGDGYWLASQVGEIRVFGDAVSYGSVDRRALVRKIVDMAVTPTGGGYWLVDGGGQVFSFGDAPALGSLPRGGADASSDVVAMAATPTGRGYWIATAAGDVFAFGDAPALGSLALGGRAQLGTEDDARRQKKIVDMTPTHTGRGYWLVDREGLVFAFGDAALHGSLARGELRSGLITAIVSTPFVNHDPVAGPDAAALDEDTSIDIDVVANDTDEDGDPLTADVLTQPAHGVASRNADGTLRYVPAPNYNGPDAFTYRVQDGFGGGADGTVTLTVRPVNDLPVAAPDAYTTDEDIVLTVAAPGVLGNDSDVDGDALVATVTVPPSHGTLTLLTAGGFTYAPDANYHGPDSFSYQVSDGQGGTATASVTLAVVSVPDAPVAGEDAYTTDEDTAVSVTPPGVLGNDSDGDGDPISAILVSRPSHGTLLLAANGGLTYTPAPDYNGADAFSYRATDGTLFSPPTSVTLTITPVNDAPVAMADAYATNEDDALVIAAPGALGNDSDIDGDALTLVLAEPPAHGTLVAMPDGSFRYLPNTNFFGTDGFRYFARDPGGLSSSTVLVTLTVRPVNDPPATVADVYVAQEDQALTVDAPGVLANDSDVDSATFSATLVAGPQHGRLVLASDGSFTYTPAAGYNGPDGFTYRAGDGALESPATSVEIVVAPVNDPPVATPDSYSLDEDTMLVVGAPGVLLNDTDVDGDQLRVRVVAFPVHGDLILFADGSFEYTPRANYNGGDSFTYEISDGIEPAMATVTLTIVSVADAPTAADDSYSVVVGSVLNTAAPGVLANDFTDTGTLSALLVTGPASGTLTLNANGSFTYTTTLTAAGSDSFTYKATNGTVDSAAATVSITVSASSGGGGGGGGGAGGGFGAARPTLVVWDFDELNLRVAGTTLTTRLGRVVSRYGTAWYIPNRGTSGRDSFVLGGIRFEVDVISDIWGY